MHFYSGLPMHFLSGVDNLAALPDDPATLQQAEARRRAEGATLAELAKSYNVGVATISRLRS
jgi:hypothetical protein